eukprot:1471025-Alexandrium_andersonii.AAC.1
MSKFAKPASSSSTHSWLAVSAASAASNAHPRMDGRSASKFATARPWSRRRATCSGRARPSRA